jgi:hypothetical protein
MARLRDIAAQANASIASVKPQSGGRSQNPVQHGKYTLAGVMELVDVPDSKSGA